MEMLAEKETALADTTAACLAVYKYTPAHGVTYYQKQYYVIKNSQGFIFTGTFTKKTLRTVANEMDQIVLSLLSYNLKKREWE